MSDQPHVFKKIKGYSWAVCQRCDLVALKNEATAKAIKKPCIGQYISVNMGKWKTDPDRGNRK